MKWLLILLASTSVAHADFELDEQVYMAKVQLGAGVALSLLGTALGGGGVGLAASDSPSGRYSAAMGLGISAAILCAVGIPLAIVGADKVKSLEKKRLALGASGVGVSF